MDLNLLPNKGPDEDLPSTDRSGAILDQMIEDIPTQCPTSPATAQNETAQSSDLVPRESQIDGSDLEGQNTTTDEQDKLIELTLGNFASNTSQPLPRLPAHEEASYATLNVPLINIGNINGTDHDVAPSSGFPPCKTAKLSSKDKARTYKKFNVAEIEKLIEGVQKYGGRYCNWKTIKNLYFKDSDRKKDQLKEKWRHMQKSAKKQTDPNLKKLYMQALNVQMSASKSKSPKCKESSES